MSEIFISNSDKCINSQQASHSQCPSKYHLSVYVVWFFLRSNGKNTLFDNFSDSCVHFNRRVNKQNRPQKKYFSTYQATHLIRCIRRPDQVDGPGQVNSDISFTLIFFGSVVCFKCSMLILVRYYLMSCYFIT